MGDRGRIYIDGNSVGGMVLYGIATVVKMGDMMVVDNRNSEVVIHV